MLFRKKIERSCAYCSQGVKLNDEQVLCMKKGIRPLNGKCRRFRYDPTKRIPSRYKALDFTQYDKKDFTL